MKMLIRRDCDYRRKHSNQDTCKYDNSLYLIMRIEPTIKKSERKTKKCDQKSNDSDALYDNIKCW